MTRPEVLPVVGASSNQAGLLAGSRAMSAWPCHSCSCRSRLRPQRTFSARRSWDWPASSVSEISDIAWPITTCRSGGLTRISGSGAVARKLSCHPVEVSFTHSKHTSATEVGQHTPATASTHGTSRSPPGPAIRACQYPSAPGRTVSSPFVTPQVSPKPSRSSADLWSARTASARGPGSRPSITNAFATAIRRSDSGYSGRCGAHPRASAASDRRQFSGFTRSSGITTSL